MSKTNPQDIEIIFKRNKDNEVFSDTESLDMNVLTELFHIGNRVNLNFPACTHADSAARWGIFEPGNPRPFELIHIIRNVLTLQKGSKILDFGCGFSSLPVFLQEKGYQVSGIDSGRSGWFQKLGENKTVTLQKIFQAPVNYMIGDVLAMDLEGKFDFIYSISVFQEVHPPQYAKQLLQKLKSFLNDNGRLLIITDIWAYYYGLSKLYQYIKYSYRAVRTNQIVAAIKKIKRHNFNCTSFNALEIPDAQKNRIISNLKKEKVHHASMAVSYKNVDS